MKVTNMVPDGWRKLKAGEIMKRGDRWLLNLVYSAEERKNVKTWVPVRNLVGQRHSKLWNTPTIRKINKPNKPNKNKKD
jgi:hypothetical protein